MNGTTPGRKSPASQKKRKGCRYGILRGDQDGPGGGAQGAVSPGGRGGALYDAAGVASAAGVEVEGGWPVMTPFHTLKVAEWPIVAAVIAYEIAAGASDQFNETWLREANR